MNKFLKLLSMFLITSIASSNLSANIILLNYGKYQVELLEHRTQSYDLNAEEDVFVKAFSQAYKDIPIEVLGLQKFNNNLNTFLKAAFQDEKDDISARKPDLYFFICKDETGKIIGMLSTDIDRKSETKKLYLRQFAVLPELWGKNVGKLLIYSALESYKLKNEVEYISLVTRRVNTISQRFYATLGCVQTKYEHAGLDPLKYVGTEGKVEIVLEKLKEKLKI